MVSQPAIRTGSSWFFFISMGYLMSPLVAASTPAWAQQFQGSFTWVVTDATGAVVAEANVTTTEEGTGFIFATRQKLLQ